MHNVKRIKREKEMEKTIKQETERLVRVMADISTPRRTLDKVRERERRKRER